MINKSRIYYLKTLNHKTDILKERRSMAIFHKIRVLVYLKKQQNGDIDA